jgi:hypothetical protein
MRRITLILVLMVSIEVNSQEVQCIPEAINIQEGDVVSADVLNEILSQLRSLQTGGIGTEDLIGTWQCTSTLRPGAEGSGVIHNGYGQNSLGLYTVTQEVIVSSHNDLKVRFNYPHNFGQGFQETGAQDCLGHVVNGKIVMTNGLTDTGSYEATCYNTGYYDIQMIANQCFRMGNINDSTTNCRKTSVPPLTPSGLSAIVTSGKISLTWNAGDNSETNYDVKRKNSPTGTYVSVGLPTSESYEDTSVVTASTYWYRIFAINNNGTSTGSNVISVVAQ